MNGRSPRTHLSIKEVAERWGLSPNFVRRLIWDGKLPATRFGRAIRILVVAVDDYAEKNTQAIEQTLSGRF